MNLAAVTTIQKVLICPILIYLIFRCSPGGVCLNDGSEIAIACQSNHCAVLTVHTSTCVPLNWMSHLLECLSTFHSLFHPIPPLPEPSPCPPPLSPTPHFLLYPSPPPLSPAKFKTKPSVLNRRGGVEVHGERGRGRDDTARNCHPCVSQAG